MLFKKKAPPPTPRTRQGMPTIQPGQVFSYYSSRRNDPNLDRSRFNREEPSSPKRSKLIYVPSMVAVVLVLAAVFYTFIVNPQPVILLHTPADGAAADIRSKPEYERETEKIIRSSAANWLKISFKSDKVVEQIKHQFPEVSEAELTLPIIAHRPVIDITLARPIVLLASQNGAVVLDINGKNIANDNQVKNLDSLNLPVVQDQTDTKADVGHTVLPRRSVEFIWNTVKQVNAQHATIDSLVLPPQAQELDVRFLGLPYVVRLNMMADPRQQLGTFFAVKERLQAEGITPSVIDVRAEDRAFYK